MTTRTEDHDEDLTGATQPGFVRATRVTPMAAGRYRASLDPRYAFGDKINGGYLLAIAARAAACAVAPADDGPDGPGAPSPVSAVAHYGSAPRAGEVDVDVEVRRQGRTSSQVHVSVTQDGRPVVDALLTMRSRRDDGPASGRSPGWSVDAPVPLPAEEDCFLMPTRPPGAPVEVPIMGVVEQRLDPQCLAFAAGAPTGRGQLRGWVRIPGVDPVDPAGLLLVADSLPPAVFDLGHTGWVPTLSLTVHLLAAPVPGPLRVRQQVRALQDGLVTQVCDVWDAAGTLVVHATQLAVVAGTVSGAADGRDATSR